MYYKGQGVAVDFEQARAWFEKAEAKHSPKSGLQLGMMYANGDGATPSYRYYPCIFACT